MPHKTRIKYENQTSAFNEPFKYLTATLEEPINQEMIKDIRVRFGIPVEGFNKWDTKEHQRFPSYWKYKKNKYQQKQFWDELKGLCGKLGLDYNNWKITLRAFIFFGLIMIVAKYEYSSILIYDYKCPPKIQNKLYPIVIRISPYTSERIIMAFIRDMFSGRIKPIQDRYKNKNIKLGKIRKRNDEIRERNEIIFQNRDKPLREIRKILAEKAIYLDDGHIGKILSLQKKKRI